MDYSTRYYSNKQETRIAKAVKGKKVSNSGAPIFKAGDVSTSNILIECKTLTKPQKSFSVKKEWIQKAKEEAFSKGKDHWAIGFSFGELENSEDYFIISQKDFQEFKSYLEELDG